MISKKALFDFVNRAGKATYAGDGKYEEHPERPGFFELVYDKESSWYYRDSYTGNSRSGGQEIVRFNDKPVWWSGYGGGMVKGKEKLSHETFEFLKKALSQDEDGFDSLRGPHAYVDGDWKYTYNQEGDIFDFYGYEEILYKGQKVFWHRTVGGVLKS
ncbi:hypothetical protein HY469_02780 [Candidatus Roizmanbacteria bacterium]|nr:hypothetical protein [Candidatus Roizmanbacteria bacterium]